MTTQRRALFSVSDKRGIVELGRALRRLGFEILSTGGTARALAGGDVPVVDVSAYTAFPEILDGRVKTLHPRIHAGILARPTREHLAEVERHGIGLIELVVVNLYPFRETVARPGATFEDAIEQIDVGGPTMVRAAAKNWERVGVVVEPADYDAVAGELERRGELSDATRRALSGKAFAHTAAYDGAIANWLTARKDGDGQPSAFSETLTLQWKLVQTLRYGENPHQQAALYRHEGAAGPSLAGARQWQGKELSYNNLMDLDAALALVQEFGAPAACIIKHSNPCGVAVGIDAADAFRRARAADPQSAFGGIVGLAIEVDAALARELSETFLEAVVAPSYSTQALELLAAKRNLRLVEVGSLGPIGLDGALDLRSVAGGLLVQSRDTALRSVADARVATRRAPTPAELRDLDFAWRVVKHVKSNAIVLAKGGATVGVGAGQMSRVDSVRIAVEKAGDAARGAVLASDAFFPFRDGVDVAAASGVTAVVQPGGSVRDAEVVQAADEHGIAMALTDERHFRH
ncbi:MAG: bifunctional phosphoribosylaminoimidazolecarboxamide formyltransferase/IMP cyclohydrolase [Myxococcota bacterium]